MLSVLSLACSIWLIGEMLRLLLVLLLMQKEQGPCGSTTTSRTKACTDAAGSRSLLFPPPLAAPVMLSEADCKAISFHLDCVIAKSAAAGTAAAHSKYDTCVIPRLFPRPIEFPCPVPCANCAILKEQKEPLKEQLKSVHKKRQFGK